MGHAGVGGDRHRKGAEAALRIRWYSSFAARRPTGVRQSINSELREVGYKLALKDFEYDVELEPLLDVVNYVKLDMATIGARAVARNAFEVGPHHVKLVATGVGTQEDFKLAGAAGRTSTRDISSASRFSSAAERLHRAVSPCCSSRARCRIRAFN